MSSCQWQSGLKLLLRKACSMDRGCFAKFGSHDAHAPPPKSSDDGALRRPMSMELDALLRSWPLLRRRRLLSKDSLRSGTVSVHAF